MFNLLIRVLLKPIRNWFNKPYYIVRNGQLFRPNGKLVVEYNPNDRKYFPNWEELERMRRLSNGSS